jgi:transcription-repair coupling factor (superfamily II helicase)
VPVLRLPLLPAEAGKQHWGNLPGAALSLAIAEAASAAKRFTLLLTADSQSAERLEQELSFFAPDLPVLHFPDWETLPYDLFSPHQDIISQRIASLYRLPELEHGVLVVPITTALHRLAPTKFLLGSSLVLDVGQKLDVEQMRSRLEASGYRYVDTVYEHGEFTVRGALIDLFPMGSKLPYRIDLFDDEIETLRTFDPENQRSIDKVDSVKLLPAREFPLQKDAVTRFKARFRERFDVDFRRCPIFQDLSSGLRPVSSTTCRCSSTKPRRCSITCRRTRKCSRCRASSKRRRISGTMCAIAMKSAASIHRVLYCHPPNCSCR